MAGESSSLAPIGPDPAPVAAREPQSRTGGVAGDRPRGRLGYHAPLCAGRLRVVHAAPSRPTLPPPLSSTDTPFLDRFDRTDGLLVVVLVAFIGLFGLKTFEPSMAPAEDAAMLMRYSQNLAEGHGITWNAGEAPVDGATDFLFMVSIGLLAKTGFSVEHSTQLIGIGAHLFTCLFVFFAIRRLHPRVRWTAWLSAAYLAIGPGLRYVEAYFGTPFFAMFTATTFYFIYRVFRGDDARLTCTLFALSSLLLGLTRPEGVFLSAFMLLGLWAARGWGRTQKLAVHYVLVFGLPGAIYFAWHWSYFGHPLPNPFYVKGGGTLYPGHLESSLRNVLALGLPFIPLLVYVTALSLARRFAGANDEGGVTSEESRELWFFLVPLLLFSAMWIFLSGATDYLMRFNYCCLPMVLLAWPAALDAFTRIWGARSGAPSRGLARNLLVATFALFALGYHYEEYKHVRHRAGGPYHVAKLLSEFPHDYTMVVTNAGLLPFYSGWRAIDAWGLNDSYIAHAGMIDEAYLDENDPELLQIDALFSPAIDVEQRYAAVRHLVGVEGTKRMVDWARARGYVLAVAYGPTPYKVHYYFVKPDLPETDEIVRRLREMDYRFESSSERCFDYATLERE